MDSVDRPGARSAPLDDLASRRAEADSGRVAGPRARSWCAPARDGARRPLAGTSAGAVVDLGWALGPHGGGRLAPGTAGARDVAVAGRRLRTGGVGCPSRRRGR